MTYGAEIVSILKADATLMSILTGSAWEYQDSGRKGFNRVQLMQAYIKQKGIAGLLKPTAIVYQMNTIATNEAVHMPSGYRSTITPVCIYIYNDGDMAYADIDSAEQRIYTLLNGTRIVNAFQVLWTNTIENKRENLLDDAALYMFECRVYGFRGGS